MEINDKYRLVSRVIDTVSPYGAGILVAYFERPIILLSIGYIDADGKLDYLSHEDVAKSPTSGGTENRFTLEQAAKNPLFFDPLGSVGILGLIGRECIDLPFNTDGELHVETAQTELLFTYLEKTN